VINKRVINKRNYNKLRAKDKRKAFCWAPFTALRFNRSGGVQACCHHVDYEYLSEKSLHDIWFSVRFNTMRAQMKTYQIPAACNFCYHDYANENYSNVKAIQLDDLFINENGYPSHMDFSLENTCNLECVMCDASLSSAIGKRNNSHFYSDYTYSVEFVEQLVEFIPYLKSAYFTGGEPFLIPINFDIWERMLQINPQIKIIITTNATVLTQKVKDVLNKGNFHLTLSIDSFNKPHYEQIRKNASFEKTMSNLDWFSAYCQDSNTHLCITVCPMQLNWMDIPEVVERCNQNDWIFDFNKVTKPWNLALWSMDADSLQNVVTLYKSFDFVPNTQNQQINKSVFKRLIVLVETYLKSALQREKYTEEQVMEIDRLRNEAINEVNNLVRKMKISEDLQHLYQKKLNSVLNLLPDMLITSAFLNSIRNFDVTILEHKVKHNSIDILIDGITEIAYNSI
jgi:MoaA/NifB/PqqE/SkfB family radical SAM enzyme